MNHCQLYLFGAPRLTWDRTPINLPLRKAMALLVYLGVTRQPHSRDALATLLWPEKDQQGARANLRRTLYDLSQLLGQTHSDQLLLVEPESVSVRTTAPLWIDTAHFQHTLAAYLPPIITADSAAPTLAPLTEAADLYTDHFLAGFTLPDCPAFAEWQFFQGEELRRSYSRLLQQVVMTYEAQELREEAIRYARRLLTVEPLDETVHRHLMRLYADTGQLAAALRQYEECVRLLADKLDLLPTAETTALYATIRTKRVSLTEKKTKRPEDKKTGEKALNPTLTPSLSHPPTALPYKLPTPTTPFLGRAQELADIFQRLHDPACRLLTLIGPGGIGKTRLAIAAAQTILFDESHLDTLSDTVSELQDNPKLKIQHEKFVDGIFFVPLQPVSMVDGLIPAIAEVTGLHFYGETPPQQQLLTFLQEKQMLLILDNFEHLLAGAETLSVLLQAAPQVKLLVTSREALNLQEEWFHPLAGLSLPTPRSALTGHQTHDVRPTSEAVQFFVQNARRVRVEFYPQAEAEHIVRICRLVDGIPLALELAATWLKVLSCAQIADELERSLDILTTRQQNIPARHRSMRAVLEQAWQLLTAPEQAVLNRLALFRGGFDQKAAHHVADATLLILAALVEKALLHQTTGRYQLHELLRQFALEQLQQSPSQLAETQTRHSRYYLTLLQTATDLQQIELDFENVRTGWRTAVAQADFIALQGAADPFYRYYARRALYQEGQHDFALVVERLAATVAQKEWLPLACTARRCLGAFCYQMGDYTAAATYLQQALQDAQALNAQGEQMWTLAFLGLIAGWQGRVAESDALFAQSLAISHQVGNAQLTVELRIKIAQLWGQQGRYTEARQLGEESLAISRKVGQAYWIIRALDVLGFTTYRLGQLDQAKHYYGEGLRLAQQTADQEGFILTSGGLGLAASKADVDQIMAVLPYVEQGLQISRQMGQPFYIMGRLTILGALHKRLKAYEPSLLYSQEGVALARKLGNPYFMVINLHYQGSAARHLRRFELSRTSLLESMSIALQTNMDSAICDGLYELALLYLANPTLPLPVGSPHDPKGEVLVWLQLVIQHPACDAAIAADAQTLIDQLSAELPGHLVAANMYPQASIEAVVKALLAVVPPVTELLG